MEMSETLVNKITNLAPKGTLRQYQGSIWTVIKSFLYYIISQWDESRSKVAFFFHALVYLQFSKVYLSWEGHKNVKNLHLTFDRNYIGQK